MKKIKIITVFGTRPEAIKMCPLIVELNKHQDIFDTRVLLTSQHKEMLYPVLDIFNIRYDFDLDIMKRGQDLWYITTSVLNQTKEIFELHQPDLVLVHGDTTTTLAASLSAFYCKIPVGHVEAGLRTFNKYYPFPEEVNRVVTDTVSTLFFVPTERSRQNLITTASAQENGIFLTGNTVIDALFYTLKHHKVDVNNMFNLDKDKKLILLTAHRRENWGQPIENIFHAVKTLASVNQDIEIVYPVHLNPHVQEPAQKILGDIPNVKLLEPLEYAPFCSLMERSHIILTDSGGIQEEAPSLGKPVLVLRDETERPEAVEYGTVKLVGPHIDSITTTTQTLLDSIEEYTKMAGKINPYGDGKACPRIVDAIRSYFDI